MSNIWRLVCVSIVEADLFAFMIIFCDEFCFEVVGFLLEAGDGLLGVDLVVTIVVLIRENFLLRDDLTNCIVFGTFVDDLTVGCLFLSF